MIPDDVREIPLAKSGLVALVSGEDFDAVNELSWRPFYRSHTIYAGANIKIIGGQRANYRGERSYWSTISMHRFITNCPPDKEAHHKDKNGLHNFRSNLVVCSRSFNLSQRGPYGESGYLGVSRDKRAGPDRWRAYISERKGKRSVTRRLGNFGSAIEAALAYDDEARRLHGPFANTNFPINGDFNYAAPPRVQSEKTEDAIPF